MLRRVIYPVEYSDYHLYVHEGEAFTGIEYHADKNGRIIEEQSYFEGMSWGFSRSWRENGTLRGEYHLRYGATDQECKEYYLEGQLKEVFFCDQGIIIRRKRWNKQGDLIENFDLENEPQHETYNRWKMGQNTSEADLTSEQMQCDLEFEQRVADFEKEIANYLAKYPSDKVYYEKDFIDS
jgi:antitoxin component YwqK of YwqJK toxin-antitoxin module